MIQQEKSPSEAKTQERQIEITRGPDFKTSRKVLNLKLKSSISPIKIMMQLYGRSNLETGNGIFKLTDDILPCSEDEVAGFRETLPRSVLPFVLDFAVFVL